jgi:hypothetical protein
MPVLSPRRIPRLATKALAILQKEGVSGLKWRVYQRFQLTEEYRRWSKPFDTLTDEIVWQSNHTLDATVHPAHFGHHAGLQHSGKMAPKSDRVRQKTSFSPTGSFASPMTRHPSHTLNRF